MIRSTAAIVTPSYPPDFERCQMLVDSLENCAPEIEHFIIVDRRDRPVFKVLENYRTHIIESEDILSRVFFSLPAPRGYWFNWRGLPVRGWIMQQIRKIAVANVIEADTLVFVDSDTAFIRKFSTDALNVDGSLGLLDVNFTGAGTTQWTEVACKLLGLDPASVVPRGHVGNLICWRRSNVIAMQQRIEEVNGIGWQEALARQRTFSEYILYGTFVRGVLGYAAARQRPSDVPLIKHSWGSGLASAEGVHAFFSDFDERTLGVMAHSKDETDLVQLRIELERQWEANEAKK